MYLIPFILALIVFTVAILWETYNLVFESIAKTDYLNKQIYKPSFKKYNSIVIGTSVLVQIIMYNLDTSLGVYFIYSIYAILIFLIPTVIFAYYKAKKRV